MPSGPQSPMASPTTISSPWAPSSWRVGAVGADGRAGACGGEPEGSGLSSPGAQAPRWAMTHTREVAGGRVRLCANHAIQQHLATQHSWGARQQLPAPSPSLCPRGLWAGGGARAPLSTAGLSVGACSGPSVRPTPLPQPVCSPGLAAGDPGVLERGARQDGGRTGGTGSGPARLPTGWSQAGA